MFPLITHAFRLNLKESQLLSLLLSHGAQPASRISKLADMPRNTTRGILDKLVAYGLLTRTLRVKTHFYAVERKERIIAALKQKLEHTQSEVQVQIEALENSGDFFARQSSNSRRPRVSFYEGFEGLQRVYEDTLSTSGLRSWGNFDSNLEALPRYFKTYYRRRAKRGISMKSIHPDTVLSRRHLLQNKRELRHGVLVPNKKYYWTPEIQVYDEKVNIVSWKDKVGLLIESKEIAEALKTIFDINFDLIMARHRKVRRKKGS